MEDYVPPGFEEITEYDIPYNTPMRDYFRGKTVLLTGGTGFLGQLYVEKLLRSEVKCLYLIMRPKKGKPSELRLKELFEGSPSDTKFMKAYKPQNRKYCQQFSKLYKQDPDFIKRIKIIEGDLELVGLGISEADLKDIEENVEIVLHSAADVRFDDHLHHLLKLNVRGTRELCRIAERIKKLQVFAYVSTAYSHCIHKKIEEKFYEAPIDPDVAIQFVEKYSQEDEIITLLQERIYYPWPNPYSFSKAIAEELVRRYGKKFPVCVIRPTIVISTHEDPIPGWFNNINGLNGIMIGCGLGILRIMMVNHALKGDIICADFVVNSTLAAIWYTHEENKDKKQISDTQVYTVCSTADRPVTWGEMAYEMRQVFETYPSANTLWKACNEATRFQFMFRILSFYYHVLPALIFELLFKITKTNTNIKMMQIYRRTTRFLVLLKYFMLNEFTFPNDNMKKILSKMDKYDHEFFPSDVRRYHWPTYTYNYNHGLRIYIGISDMEDVPAARKRLALFKIAHLVILSLYYSFNVFLFYTLFKYFGVIDGIKNMVADTYEFLRDPK